MRMGTLATFVFALLVNLAGCAPASYPNSVPKATQYEDGRYGLEGWKHLGEGRNDAVRSRIVPEERAFRGAISYFMQVDTSNPATAAKRAVRAEGLRGPRVLARTTLDPDISKHVEPDPEGRIHSVMLEGRLNGRDARAIAVVWYGSYGHAEGEPSNSGVHVFMAPKDVFEAMGGYAVVAVRHFGAVSSGRMDRDGRLRPKVATTKLNDVMAHWVVGYVEQMMVMQMMMGQTMAIQQQTIDHMMSYNNALSTCAGLDNCSIQMDGTGGWYADIQ